MISAREMMFEKLQDQLALEAKAAELYEEASRNTLDQRVRDILENLRKEEIYHVSLVRELLDLIKPYSSFRKKNL